LGRRPTIVANTLPAFADFEGALARRFCLLSQRLERIRCQGVFVLIGHGGILKPNPM
jgi:hypothetical protein